MGYPEAIAKILFTFVFEPEISYYYLSIIGKPILLFKITKKRSAQQFNDLRESSYGLRSNSRDKNGKVNGVKYLFCCSFGRQQSNSTSRPTKNKIHLTLSHVDNSLRLDY